MIEDLYEKYWNNEEYELCRYMVLKELNKDLINLNLRFELSILNYLTHRLKESIEELELIQKLNKDYRPEDVKKAIRLLSAKLVMYPYL